MQYLQGFDSTFVLAVLNNETLPPNFSARAAFLASIPPGMNDVQAWAMRDDLPDVDPEDEWSDMVLDGLLPYTPMYDVIHQHAKQFVKEHNFRQRLIREHAKEWKSVTGPLRKYVDEWIQTGYDAAGIETPQRRYLSVELQPQLTSFTKQNPMWTHVLGWGEIECGWPISLPGDDGFAEHEAGRLMVSLLGSEFKYTVAKCLKPSCGIYFERTKLQPNFVRGAWCSEHTKGAGTDIMLNREKDARLELAATFWPQWTERKHPIRAVWVAERMNEQRKATEKRVTRNWVSTNVSEIEKLVETRSNKNA